MKQFRFKTLMSLFAAVAMLFATSLTAQAQIPAVSIDVKNVSVKELFKTIEAESGYTFAYVDSEIDLSKNVSVPSFSYKNNIESLEISIFSEDAKKEIPVFLCDYCREIAKNGGFSLEFSYKDGRALMTSRIDSVSSKGISFTAPMPEDYTFVSLLCALLVV
jgi:hypothetical protein